MAKKKKRKGKWKLSGHECGWQCATAGTPLHKNPFPMGSVKYQTFVDGWNGYHTTVEARAERARKRRILKEQP